MAGLIGGIAGAGLGSLVGFPALGWFVGSTLGSEFGPHPEPTWLTDLNIPTSKYGTGIAQVFGTARVSGNIIWTGAAQAHMVNAGGKGGK